jgi:hypothetical protein
MFSFFSSKVMIQYMQPITFLGAGTIYGHERKIWLKTEKIKIEFEALPVIGARPFAEYNGSYSELYNPVEQVIFNKYERVTTCYLKPMFISVGSNYEIKEELIERLKHFTGYGYKEHNPSAWKLMNEVEGAAESERFLFGLSTTWPPEFDKILSITLDLEIHLGDENSQNVRFYRKILLDHVPQIGTSFYFDSWHSGKLVSLEYNISDKSYFGKVIPSNDFGGFSEHYVSNGKANSINIATMKDKNNFLANMAIEG